MAGSTKVVATITVAVYSRIGLVQQVAVVGTSVRGVGCTSETLASGSANTTVCASGVVRSCKTLTGGVVRTSETLAGGVVRASETLTCGVVSTRAIGSASIA